MNRNPSLQVDRNDPPKVFFGAFCAMWVLSLAFSQAQGNAAVYLGYLAPQLAYLGAIAVYLIVKKFPPSVVLPSRPVRRFSPVALVLFTVATVGVFFQNYLFSVLTAWGADAVGLTANVTLPVRTAWYDDLISVLLLAVLPALGEEAMFRGVFLSAYPEGQKGRGILFAAGVFALSHLNIAQLIHPFLLAVVLGYVVAATGQIAYAVWMHCFNNLLALFLPRLFPWFASVPSPGWDTFGILFGGAAAGAVLAAFSLYFAVRFAASRADCNADPVIFRFVGNNFAKVCYNNKNGVSAFPWNAATLAILAALLVFVTVLQAVGSV